jgi:ribose 1,5-bisphosphate isomerase
MSLKSISEEIRSLKIQGATNIALSVLSAVESELSDGRDTRDLRVYEEIVDGARTLAFSRPTEPLAQNAIRYVFSLSYQPASYYLKQISHFKSLMNEVKMAMAETGRVLIEEGKTYLTHCHSSTVVNMFVSAWKQGARFAVVATETRPKYQGRTTVKELLDAGIEDVTMIIDDAAASVIEGNIQTIDGVFIGADLLSEQGFVNKVGSFGIASSTNRKGIPLYSVTTLLKFDPRVFSSEVLEERSEDEVWEDKPEKLKIFSPSFDFVPYMENVRIVSEAGTMKALTVGATARRLYPFLS